MKNISSNYGFIVPHRTYDRGWKMTNFLDCCQKSGEYITSPIFSTHEGRMDWQLKLYPHGNQQVHNDYMSFYIVSLNNFKVKLRCQFIINVNGECRNKIDQWIFPYQSVGFDKFFEKKKVFDLVQTLKNVCHIFFKIDDDNTFSDFVTYSVSTETTERKELKNLSRLLNNEHFCDVTIIVSGKKFRASKAILAAYSPVFEAMFTHNMSEKKTNTIEIEDIKPEIFEHLLTYIYTAEIKKDKKIIEDLLGVANRYAMDELKYLCGLRIFETINTTNACEILVIADIHNEDKLKSLTIEFIVNNARDIVCKQELQMLKNTNIQTVIELFKSLALTQK